MLTVKECFHTNKPCTFLKCMILYKCRKQKELQNHADNFRKLRRNLFTTRAIT